MRPVPRAATALCVLAAVSAPAIAPPSTPGTAPPAVLGVVVNQLSAQHAVLKITVLPDSQVTSVAVEYGPGASYGATTAAGRAPASSGEFTVTRPVSGLTAATTYHYRAVATNASGTTYGPDALLTTPAESASGPAPGDPADAPAPGADLAGSTPVAGRTVVAGPVSGTVRVRRPGGVAYEEIDAAAALPVGSTVDTSAGSVAVTSAMGAAGATQTATFWGGVFQIRQTRAADGYVDLHLRGPAPACPRPGVQAANATRRPVARSLWGKDSGGRYRTHGRNSVATVRGTVWMTRETCAGTLTRVLEGAVSVRDVRRARTVLVRAGGRHLARARR